MLFIEKARKSKKEQERSSGEAPSLQQDAAYPSSPLLALSPARCCISEFIIRLAIHLLISQSESGHLEWPRPSGDGQELGHGPFVDGPGQEHL